MSTSKINWITENKHVILSLDFTNLYGKDFINQINNLASFLQHTKKTEILALIDITNSFLNTEVFKAIRSTAKLANKKVKKTAIIGSTPVQITFIKFLKTLTRFQLNTFQTKKQAIQWLTKQEK